MKTILSILILLSIYSCTESNHTVIVGKWRGVEHGCVIDTLEFLNNGLWKEQGTIPKTGSFPKLIGKWKCRNDSIVFYSKHNESDSLMIDSTVHKLVMEDTILLILTKQLGTSDTLRLSRIPN